MVVNASCLAIGSHDLDMLLACRSMCSSRIHYPPYLSVFVGRLAVSLRFILKSDTESLSWLYGEFQARFDSTLKRVAIFRFRCVVRRTWMYLCLVLLLKSQV
jgi:hypothetical protein